jgi:hypothetical protein
MDKMGALTSTQWGFLVHILTELPAVARYSGLLYNDGSPNPRVQWVYCQYSMALVSHIVIAATFLLQPAERGRTSFGAACGLAVYHIAPIWRSSSLLFFEQNRPEEVRKPSAKSDGQSESQREDNRDEAFQPWLVLCSHLITLTTLLFGAADSYANWQ